MQTGRARAELERSTAAVQKLACQAIAKLHDLLVRYNIDESEKEVAPLWSAAALQPPTT